MQCLQIKTNVLLTALSTLVSLSAFGYCLFLLWSGRILYGDMAFFLGQRSTLTSHFNTLVATIPSMMNTAISTHRIREIIDLPKEEHDPVLYRRIKAKAQEGLSIELNGVTFAYADGKTVYRNAAFEAHPGEIVAILGESGGGKTTLFRLLLGLVHPADGSGVLKCLICKGDNGMLKENLGLLRRIRGFSQEQIAEKVRVSRQAYAKWESGATVPDIEKCCQLAEIYGITLDSLVKTESVDGIGVLPPAPKGKHIWGSVTVSDRGQLVIPKGAREQFGLTGGNRLIVLSDDTGMVLMPAEKFEAAIQAVMQLAAVENADNG